MISRHLGYQEAAVLTTDKVFSALNSGPSGLSKKEQLARLQEAGPNEIEQGHKTAWLIFTRQLRSPFIYLLAAAAAISFFTGDRENVIMIVLFMAINTGLGFFQ